MIEASPAFQPVQRTTVVEDIIGQIRDLMRGNRYAPGSKLPSERDLARRLKVSRPSVREALRTLTHMGVLDTRHGSGSQVAGSGKKVLKAPLQFLLMLDQPSIADIHETREVIDIFLAGCAAKRRTDADLEAMEAPLAELKVSMRRKKGVTDPDFRFHQALWTAAHHPILARFMACMQENVHALIDSVQPSVHDYRASYEIHERIFTSLRRRNAPQARRAMQVHHDMMTDELREAKLLP